MGKLKKAIATFLVACMTMVTPLSAGMSNVSASETKQTNLKTKMSVYSIDAGRKFFSVEQLKEIIDTAEKIGYTHVQILFGNDGLRLLLDDMSITANGQTYASDDVKEAIKNGTKTYYDGTDGASKDPGQGSLYLTQSDIEDILAYAKTKNIGIIPVVSSPGHMDAILNAMETLGIEKSKFDYKGYVSKTTIDLANEKAVNFTKALVEKYAEYFNGKVDYFNFGADEYANDSTLNNTALPEKKSGFLVLQELGLYDEFVNYINSLSAIIKANNMKPICFNDGIYYKEDETCGKIDTDIIVAYWITGIPSYEQASAKFLRKKGFNILNTNDNWYYVVGRDGNKASWWYGTDMATKGMKNNKFTHVPTANDKEISIVGAMACTWCDTPSETYKPEIVKDLMELFAQQNPDYIYKVADYTKVEEAIAQIPADLSKYTEESVHELKKAYEAVVYGERLENQAKVDAMADAIIKEISELKVATSKKAKKAIFSIDAGRKYFSKEQLIQIINKAYNNGYTDVQLIVGNDGLRFALDDMTIKSNGKTYKSEDVKKAITEGNNIYYKDSNGDYLTETEMNEILAHARRLGIGIIPVINSPGHMDGILNAMEALGIQNPQYSHNGKKSTRTIDLNNEEALAFNKELVKKYATYFAGKGSKIFNFGCDEYANDIDSSAEGYYNGWSRLQGEGMYPKFVEYVNDLSKIIKDAGMKPMCFNDGIYYNKKDEYGTFDKDIIISYWTAGWWEFYTAPASYLYEKGHQILNLNDAWYWVLGSFTGGNLPYKFEDALANIEKKGFNDVAGDNTGVPTIGSMQAVWCDDPSQAHDMDRIMQLMDRYSEKHKDYLIRPNTDNNGGGTITPGNPNKPEKPEVNVDRLEGSNRIETAIEASKDLFSNGTNVVVLANADRFTDVLAANPLAAQENASSLLTNKDKLAENTLKEIERLGAKKIYISGGYEAVSKKVVDELKNKGYEVVRFDGKDRYETARKIADKVREKGNKEVVELASGENFPDALAMTSMAVRDNAPILLTKENSMPAETKKALAEYDVKTVKIAGLEKAVSKDVEKQIKDGFEIVKGNKEDNNVYDGAESIRRIGGKDRYETASKIANEIYPTTKLGVYATGENFPDALIAGNYAAKKHSPVLLVKKNTLPESVKVYTENAKMEKVTIIGGADAVAENVVEMIKEAIK